MLPARHRMRGSEEFAATIRAGARHGSHRLVVHFREDPESTPATSARVGFVVSKAVGGAVQRNVVRRRLRAAMALELASLPQGSAVVVRALPAAAGASYGQLRADLATGLHRARARADKVRQR